MSGGKRRCKNCGQGYTGACSCTVLVPTKTETFERAAKEVMEVHKGTFQQLAEYERQELRRLSAKEIASGKLKVGESCLLDSNSGGTKFDSGKPRMDLIPPFAEEEEAYVWGFGAQKYGDENWKQGIKFKRIVGAIQRHLNAIKKGEFTDPESKRLHAASIRCNAAMLIEFIKTGRTDLDDISKKDKN